MWILLFVSVNVGDMSHNVSKKLTITICIL